MTDYGIKVLKPQAKLGQTSPKNLFLSSDNILLKIHKQGSFRMRIVSTVDITVTIRYDDLGYRPFVLVYAQRRNHDGTTDTTYHLLDWEYHGATQEGWQRTKIYSDRFELNYIEQDADAGGPPIIDLYGYYYVFKEEIKE